MTRGLLFGTSSGSQSHSKYLVEFRAGKMTLKGKMVHPDKRKGTVYVHQSDDSLMHFCWKDRTSGAVEDDLIIFPDDAEFKKVAQCTTGRVYVLKFKSSSRRCFYWMQEPKNDKDEELVRKVNEFLNNPPMPGSSRGGAGGAGGSGTSLQSDLNNIGDEELQNLLNNMSQHQLVQLLGGIGGMSGVTNLSSLLGSSRPSSQGAGSASAAANSSDTASAAAAPATPATTASTTTTGSTSTTLGAAETATTTTTTTAVAAASATTTPAAGSSAASSAAIQLSDLQNILSGIKVPPSEQPIGDAGKEPSVNVDLSAAISSEAVLQPLLNNRELMARVEALLPSATESSSRPDVSEQLKDTVKSPQFQQALSLFSAALQSGQLGPLMQQFGMDPQVVSAATSGDMEAFVKALQSSKVSLEDNKGQKKEDTGDEDMGLD
uniref:Proteasomal ubiquitin receptor ADRM1 homolog n=1 Tax=Ixodes ricinus TaxID=34613 RepID=A0A131XPV8_IXORI